MVTTTRHAGTRRFLSTLPPRERTRLMAGTGEDRTLAALRYVMERYHDNDWRTLLGDLQLSFVVFLNLHCLTRWNIGGI